MREKPRLTVGALVFNNNKLILLQSPKYNGRYILPGGHVNFMELIEDAVRREVREETGLEVNNLKFVKFIEFINPEQYYKKRLHFVGMQYLCQTPQRNVTLNKEATDYLWTSPQKALNLDLEDGTKKTIEYYLHNFI